MCNREKVVTMIDHWCLTGKETKYGFNGKSSGANRFGISTELYQFALNLSFSVTVKGIFSASFYGNRTRLLMSFDSVSQSIKWKGLYRFHGSINSQMLVLHPQICVLNSRVLLKQIDAAHYWATPFHGSKFWQCDKHSHVYKQIYNKYNTSVITKARL